MSWTNLDIKLQPRVSHCNLTVSRTPVSSLHVPNLPATRGAVDIAQVSSLTLNHLGCCHIPPLRHADACCRSLQLPLLGGKLRSVGGLAVNAARRA